MESEQVADSPLLTQSIVDTAFHSDSLLQRPVEMRWPFSALALAAAALVLATEAVDRNKFRKCSQSGFCTRARGQPEGRSPFRLDMSSLTATGAGAEAVVLNADTDVQFKLELSAVEGGTFRLRLVEAFPLRPRFEVPLALVEDAPKLAAAKITDKSDAGFTLAAEKRPADRLVVQADPLRVDAYSDGVLVLSANARGLLRFEHTREKKAESEGDPANDIDPYDILEDNDDQQQQEGQAEQNQQQHPEEEKKAAAEEELHSAWEESFGGNTDSKPYGPQAIAMDFAFVDTDHVYGIPEHAERFSLQDTTGGEPYR